jgi:cytochrome c-type biogenesis protein CcmH/NrfG
MSYLRGLVFAVAFDIAWIIATPSLTTEPERSPNPVALMSSELGETDMQTSPEDAQLDEAGRLEDSLMVYLQSHDDDVATMLNLARMYAAHAWYDAAIGPLARAAQLDPERRSVWSLLDRALKMTGKTQMTDAELTKRAAAFVEAVEMWGHGC